MTPSIAKRVEDYFGERVMTITTPGGKRRGSYRVNFQTWSLIVSCRDNVARTHYEARILEELQDISDVSPKFLGLDNNLMFQSDVGGYSSSGSTGASVEIRRSGRPGR